MSLDWNEVQKVISPVKNFEDLCHRFRTSFGYSFVISQFNYSLPQLIDYTQKLLLGDSRGRYIDYCAKLAGIMTNLEQWGILNVLELTEQTSSPNLFEIFVDQSSISAPDIVLVLKYLIYWFVPGEKYLSGLVQADSNVLKVIKSLRQAEVRTNLQLLEKGITAENRMFLAENTGVSLDAISDLVNRADFSRLPWASKATISNIIGAGYNSLSKLANANPDQLYADFFRYGKSIGKNLKLGNEIETSYRIAKIVPVIIQEDSPHS
jgi:hypothetical protein